MSKKIIELQGKENPFFKRLMYRLTQLRNQGTNTRLKSAHTTGERDPLTNFGVPAREAGDS